MAQAYPKSRVFAFDYHGPSIEKLRKVALDAGFSRFRRATETPFNMVFEAKM